MSAVLHGRRALTPVASAPCGGRAARGWSGKHAARGVERDAHGLVLLP